MNVVGHDDKFVQGDMWVVVDEVSPAIPNYGAETVRPHLTVANFTEQRDSPLSDSSHEESAFF